MKVRKIDSRGFAHDIVLVMFAVIFAIAGIGYLVASHADQVTQYGAFAVGPNPCASPVNLKSAENIDGSGHLNGSIRSAAETNKLQSKLARRFHYNVGGSDVEETVPPDGWSPLTASDQELQTYGFPAKPTDATALQNWQAEFANYKGSGTPGLCPTNFKSTNVLYTYSNNWAGGLALNNAYGQNLFTSASGKWSQTGVRNSCGPSAQYATWVGLGGVPSSFSAVYNRVGGDPYGGLIQTGTDYYMYGGTTPVNFAWYEAISTRFPFPMIAFSGSSNVISPGDQINAGITYNMSNGTGNFLVIDTTKGLSWGAGAVPGVSYNGQYVPMSYFYDGTTTDYIVEPPTNLATNKVYPLAQPNLGNTYYYAAYANYTTFSSFRTATLSQLSSRAGSPVVDKSTFNGVTPWEDIWKSCT